MKRASIYLLIFPSLCLGPVCSGYKNETGFNRLAAEQGTNLASGVGMAVSHIEASGNPTNSIYMPDTNNLEFVSKTITDISGVNTSFTGHATLVGRYYYGDPLSVAPDISDIDVYWAEDWLEDGFLRDPPFAPGTETGRVQNHSWISHPPGTSEVHKLLRLDHAVDRDGFTCAVGVNNGSGSGIPQLLATSYHTISVGLSSGNHSSGTTLSDGPGRTKPEIVGPNTVVSFAVPMVSGAAALLLDTADQAGFTHAQKPQVTKAILLAGATKQEFPDWDRTPARPLDETYGAGELNTYQSWHVLTSGRQPASPTNHLSVRGWDYQSLSTNDTARYFIHVPPDYFLHRLSFITTWHRIIADTDPGPGFEYSAHLNNVDVFCYTSTGFTPHVMIDLSTSQVDNVEHIYQPVLGAGEYLVEIQADGPADSGVAWFGTLAKVPQGQAGLSNPDGTYTVQATVSSNIPYQVEAATNLVGTVDWDRIHSGSSTSGVLEYLDMDATNFTSRFYRFLPEP